MKIKKIITSGVLAVALAVSSVAFAAVPALPLEAKGPDKTSGMLLIGDDALYVGSALEGEHSVKKVKGATYDAKTNTLTLNNFNKPDAIISVGYMGSDFKIAVKGKKNSVATISGYTYGSPLSITFTGSGKIAVNKKKTFANGIEIQYNDAASKIVFAKKVKVEAYSGDVGYPVYVYSSVSDVNKAIVKKGGSMTECKAGEDGEFYCDAAKFVKK